MRQVRWERPGWRCWRHSTTASSVAEHLGLQPQSLTRLLDSLEADGMCQRQPDEADRRQRWIELTDAGRRALEEELRGRRDRLADAMARELTDTETEFRRRRIPRSPKHPAIPCPPTSRW